MSENAAWPCPTVQALQAELERTENRDDPYALD